MAVDMNVNVQSVKEGMNKAYHLVGDWLGRSVEIIKSNSTIQNRGVAVVSLFVVNMLLFNLVVYNHERFDLETKHEAIAWGVALGTIGLGVFLFSKATHLPLSVLTITGISLATLVLRANTI